jgi:hypothetical protein
VCICHVLDIFAQSKKIKILNIIEARYFLFYSLFVLCEDQEYIIYEAKDFLNNSQENLPGLYFEEANPVYFLHIDEQRTLKKTGSCDIAFPFVSVYV